MGKHCLLMGTTLSYLTFLPPFFVFFLPEFCAPHEEENTCSVVNGATAILLDNHSSNIQDIVYDTIANALDKIDQVQRFAPFVVRAEFRNPMEETLILSDDSSKPSLADDSTPPGAVTATVAVAAASVSFLVASIFCYGLMRREIRHHPEPSIRHKFRRTASRSIVGGGHPMLGLGHGAHRHPRRFVRLDELATAHAASKLRFMGGMGTMHDIDDDHDDDVEDYDCHQDHEPSPDNRGLSSSQNRYGPSITWSISDITSDSASLRSGVSWTTSKLERIEEADEEEEYDDCGGLPNRKRKRLGLIGGRNKSSFPPQSPSPKLSRSSSSVEVIVGMDKLEASRMATVNHFHHDNIPFDDLAGCRDLQQYQADTNVRSVTPVSNAEENPGLSSPVTPVMPEPDDDDDDDDDVVSSATPPSGTTMPTSQGDGVISDSLTSRDDDSTTSSVYLVPPSDVHKAVDEPSMEPRTDDSNVALGNTCDDDDSSSHEVSASEETIWGPSRLVHNHPPGSSLHGASEPDVDHHSTLSNNSIPSTTLTCIGRDSEESLKVGLPSSVVGDDGLDDSISEMDGIDVHYSLSKKGTITVPSQDETCVPTSEDFPVTTLIVVDDEEAGTHSTQRDQTSSRIKDEPSSQHSIEQQIVVYVEAAADRSMVVENKMESSSSNSSFASCRENDDGVLQSSIEQELSLRSLDIFSTPEQQERQESSSSSTDDIFAEPASSLVYDDDGSSLIAKPASSLVHDDDRSSSTTASEV